MKKRIIVGSIIALIGIIIYIFPQKEYQEKNLIISETKKMTPNNDGISIMYETSVGSGEYIQSEESNWLGEGYTFNSELSKCENGGTLTWNETTKKVKLSANKSDKCYVYFDKEDPKPIIKEVVLKYEDCFGRDKTPEVGVTLSSVSLEKDMDIAKYYIRVNEKDKTMINPNFKETNIGEYNHFENIIFENDIFDGEINLIVDIIVENKNKIESDIYSEPINIWYNTTTACRDEIDIEEPEEPL